MADRLLELIRACVAEGPVKLASGAVSDFYIDGRLVTLSPEGSLLAGQAILDHAREVGATAIAGPTTGACPLVTAAGVLAAQQGLALKLAYVRGQAKGHGMGKVVEGPELDASDKVLVVDDVVTSGGSFLKAIDALRDCTDAAVIGAWCLVDRQAGGRESMAEGGVELTALFTREQVQAE